MKNVSLMWVLWQCVLMMGSVSASSGPVVITNSTISALVPGSHPEVAVAGRGDQITVAFTGVYSLKTGIFVQQMTEGSALSEPVRLTPAEGAAWSHPTLWMDSGGGLHCAWLGKESRLTYRVYYARKPFGSESWGPATVISPVLVSETVPVLAGDSKTIYILHKGRPKDGLGRIYLWVSDDGGVSWKLSDPNYPPEVKKGHARSPSLAVSEGGGLHLVWLDPTPGGVSVVYNQSSDHGGSWLEQPVTLNEDTRLSLRNPKIVLSEKFLQIGWSMDVFAETGQKTEVWAVVSRDKGKSWSKNGQIFSRNVKDVTFELYDLKGTLGCVWTEHNRQREAAMWERVFWRQDQFVEDALRPLVKVAPNSRLKDLRLVNSSPPFLVCSKSSGIDAAGLVVVMFKGEGEDGWKSVELLPTASGLDTRGAVPFLGSRDPVYTVVFHEARRRFHFMEPGDVKTKLVFIQYNSEGELVQ